MDALTHQKGARLVYHSPQIKKSTPNQSQASTQPASTAPQPTTRIQSQPPPSTVPTGRGRGRRGRPPGRGQSRKVTVPRGVCLYEIQLIGMMNFKMGD